MLLQADNQIDDDDFQRVRDVVYKHCGISLNAEKKSLVQARIAKQIRAGGHASAREYLDRVLSNSAAPAFSDFIDAISTNPTSFFREDEHFQYLSDTVLPAILACRRQTGDGRILAWSAACSSGEEPYSMAITLLEAIDQFPPSSLRWDVRILATDISTRMLAAARRGTYKESAINRVPLAFRSKYFIANSTNGREAPLYSVSPELRNVVRLRHLNLIDAWPFKGPFDFIFCRNVMIYFDHQTQESLVGRFWNCLKPAGLLFTGHSESLTGIAHRFVHCRASIYQKAE